MLMHLFLQMAAADMAVSMLLLLLLTTVNQAAVALTTNTLTSDQLHTVLGLLTVTHRHFAPGNTLVVSMPRTRPDVARSVLSDPLQQRVDLQTVSVLLGNIYSREQDD